MTYRRSTSHPQVSLCTHGKTHMGLARRPLVGCAQSSLLIIEQLRGVFVLVYKYKHAHTPPNQPLTDSDTPQPPCSTPHSPCVRYALKRRSRVLCMLYF